MMRSRVLAPVAVLTVAGLLGSACTGPRSDPEPGTPGPTPVVGEPAQWRPCPELLDELLGDVAPSGLLDQLAEQVSYECTTVAVPQDWDEPEAPESFDIALVRARSADQRDRIGSLLINPGGPGASGVEAAVFLSLGPLLGGLPDTVRNRFDVVGFDPRGVGRSSPVECFSDAELDETFGADPDPGPAEFEATVTEQREQAQACAAKYGEALGLFSTRQTAHDLEALRQAVGDEQLNYLGFSYGTLLGAVYAQLYPQQVRAMVLDGAVDPDEDLIESSRGQAEGFERALDNFADWCGEQADGCPLGADPRAAIADALEQARQSPVAGDDGRDASAGWVFWAVVSALYSQELWPQLAGAIEQLDRGDPSGVFELADAYTRRDSDGDYTNMFDANVAINCADDDTEVTTERVRQLQEQWREDYPLFGAPLAAGVLGCALWPAEPDPYPTGPAEGAPPIVVVGTRGDPATPYESTAALAEMLGVGVVVTSEGEGHTAYPENECIAELVDAYLVDLTVPDEGATCPA